MNEKLYDALEACVQALDTGADLEGVLARYQDLSEELRPLLETMLQAQSLSVPSAPEEAVRRGRARVLQHAAGMREANRKPRASGFMLARLALSLALAFIFILSGSGLLRASAGALPGDNLYPVKRTWEDVRLLFVLDVEAREELEYEYENERLEETSELLSKGRYATVSFRGTVEEINEDQWLVSGIKVLIVAESQLPPEPVTIGASIMVEGHSNSQGFIEIEFVKLLKPGVFPPQSEPATVKNPEQEKPSDNSSLDENSNADDSNNADDSPGADNDNHSNNNDRRDQSDDGDYRTDENSNDNNSSDDNDSSGSNSGSGGGAEDDEPDEPEDN